MVPHTYCIWGACFLQALDLSPELWRIGTMCVCYMLPCLSVERRINNRLARLLSWSLGSRLLAHFLQRTVLLLLTVAVRCAKFRSIKSQSPGSLLRIPLPMQNGNLRTASECQQLQSCHRHGSKTVPAQTAGTTKCHVIFVVFSKF